MELDEYDQVGGDSPKHAGQGSSVHLEVHKIFMVSK